jgi:hypothetical protein
MTGTAQTDGREKHACVQREGFTVPLIGLPPSAVLEECECCHIEFGLGKLEFNGVQMLCEKCRKP